MSGKLCLVALVVAGFAALVASHRPLPPLPRPEIAPAARERPWLTHEAAARIIAPGGRLGPLFDGVTLGGPTPAPEVRARIASFAHTHDVDIDLDIVDGYVEGIRFAVSYGGCCGYEGADVLATRLRRPSSGRCCVCGPDRWFDDWAIAFEDGTHMRASVRVNRVNVYWEPLLTTREVIERLDAMLGNDPRELARAAGSRWRRDSDASYTLELPYPFGTYYGAVRHSASEIGVGAHAQVHDGRVIGVRAQLGSALRHEDGRVTLLDEDVVGAMRARWGRPRVSRSPDETWWQWRKRDRVITAVVGSAGSRVVLESSEPRWSKD